MDVEPALISENESNIEISEPELNLTHDPRVQWLKEKILAYVGMNDDELFYNMLVTPEAKEKITTFLAVPLKPNELSLDKKTFYITKIIVDKLIHEDKEFTEWRIVPPPPPPPPKDKKKKKKKGGGPDPEPEEDLSKKSAKSMKSMKSMKSVKDMDMEEEDIETAAADVQDDDVDVKSTYQLEHVEEEEKPSLPDEKYYFPPPPEDLDPDVDGTLEYYTVIRSIPRIIKYPKLIPVFGAFTPQVTHRNRRYIYFMRQTPDAIPLADNDEVTKFLMPKYILAGSTTGKVLMSLGLRLKEAFIPLFRNQFREVMLSGDDSNNSSEVSRQVSFAGKHHTMDKTASQVNYLRPSDYRRMSNIARGENAEKRIKNMRSESIAEMKSFKDIKSTSKITSDIFEIVESATDKQNSTGEEVVTDINELVSIVDWTIEHIEGEIHLPMPNIPALMEEPAAGAHVEFDDPVLNAQLEEAVRMWETHIDNTISACLNKIHEGEGPVAEYNYWRVRDAEISLLVEQLKQPMVVKILYTLQKVNSPIIEVNN